MVDINDNNEIHLTVFFFQESNMNVIGTPPKTRTQEYVTRTLRSMEDKVCDWNRLNTLVLYYYHNYSHLDPTERYTICTSSSYSSSSLSETASGMQRQVYLADVI